MKKSNLKLSRTQSIWLIGDLLVLLVVTLFGFDSHSADTEITISRMWSTWVPWSVAWLLLAPHLGVFDEQRMQDGKQLWRPFWAMILASPMGGMLRGFWLGASVLPLFIVIFGGVATLAVTGWRAIYWALFVRQKRADG